MLKRTWLLIKELPEYLSALVIVTCFSLGIVIGQYLKDGGYL
jgi:hypothetical protein